jgi:signal transduction histidine kinase
LIPEYILQNKLFFQVNKDKLNILNNYDFRLSKYEKDRIIIEENTISSELYLIIKGTVSIQKMLPNGEFLEIAKRKENDYVGEMGLIDGTLRSARVICVEDSEIVPISKEDFFSILDNIPEIKATISKEISSNLRQMHEKTMNEYDRNLQLLELNKKISNQNKELQELNLLKNNLIQMITHDLKIPLTIISGYTSLLSERLTKKPESDMINSIEIAIKQMFDMIEMLLESTRLENKELKLNIKNQNIVPYLKEIIEQFQFLAKAKDQKINLKVTDQTLYALIDSDKFKRIIGNLISNAIKYSPYYSEIFINVEKEIFNNKKYVKISVIDNGPGITEDEQKKLFRKFEKLSNKPTAGEFSSGLGLFIVKQLVELHGGFYGVKSNQNEGSCFYVQFQSE